MKSAIISGTGIYDLPGLDLHRETIDTPYGQVQVLLGRGKMEDLILLPRHGPEHHIPPHRINYRANMKALQQLGVQRVLAIFTVGSLTEDFPPRSLTLLDQFLDFTHGRDTTYYDGNETGFIHAIVTEPFCSALREHLLALAPKHDLQLLPHGTYVCVNGPRLETAAEVRMFAQMGGHVVGMTGVPEIPLARELGLHYAAVALSVNWGAGLKETLDIDQEATQGVRTSLIPLYLETLRTATLPPCTCERSSFVIHPPEGGSPSGGNQG